jgi:hypothetical protein
VTDRIRVSVGSPPWRPDPETSLDKVIQRGTIPLVGIVSQHDVKYVFWCAIGHASEANLWLYAHVTEDSAERLSSAKTQEELVSILREVTSGRAEIVALALNDDKERGIVLTAPLDPALGFGEDLSPAAAAISARVQEVTHAAEVTAGQSVRVLASTA